MFRSHAHRIAILTGVALAAGAGCAPADVEAEGDHAQQEGEAVINGTPFTGTDRLALILTSSGGCTRDHDHQQMGAHRRPLRRGGRLPQPDQCHAEHQREQPADPRGHARGQPPEPRLLAHRAGEPDDDLWDDLGLPEQHVHVHRGEPVGAGGWRSRASATSSCSGTGFGTLRRGTMVASSFPDQYNITYQPWNNNGQSAGAGDSGQGRSGSSSTGSPTRPAWRRPASAPGPRTPPGPRTSSSGCSRWFTTPPSTSPPPTRRGAACGTSPARATPDFGSARCGSNAGSRPTPYFSPCPGTASDYSITANYTHQGSDELLFASNYPTHYLTGSGTTTAPGNGSMFLGLPHRAWGPRAPG